MKISHSAQKQVVGIEAFGWFAPHTFDFCLFEPRRDCTHHTCGHLVLQFEDILDRSFEAICPKMGRGRGIDKLPGNSDSIGRFPHTAFEKVPHAQLAARLRHVHRPAFVREARIARDHKQPAETRQSGNDVLDHPISRVLLLGIATQVRERKHCNRRLVRESKSWLCGRSRSHELFAREAVDADRLRNVLKLLLAEVHKRELHLAADVFIHLAGDANAPGLCKVFETRSDVDAVAIDAGVVKDDITLIDTDAETHATSFFYISIALRHRSLDRHRTFGCAHDAAKLRQDTVTSGVNDAAAVLLDHREYDSLMLLETANRIGFIRAHEGAVSCDVGRKNCRQPAGNLGLFWPFRHLRHLADTWSKY